MKTLSHKCTRCKKYGNCNDLCVFVEDMMKEVEQTSGPTNSVEYNDAIITADYKDVLNEIRKAHDARSKVSIKQIRGIRNLRLRAIAVMIYAGLSIMDIAAILSKSESQVYRIIRMSSKANRLDN